MAFVSRLLSPSAEGQATPPPIAPYAAAPLLAITPNLGSGAAARAAAAAAAGGGSGLTLGGGSSGGSRTTLGGQA